MWLPFFKHRQLMVCIQHRTQDGFFIDPILFASGKDLRQISHGRHCRDAAVRLLHRVCHHTVLCPVTSAHTDGFLAVQHRKPFVMVQTFFTGLCKLPQHALHCAALFRPDACDAVSGPSREKQLIAFQLRRTNCFCRRAPVRHLVQVHVAAVCKVHLFLYSFHLAVCVSCHLFCRQAY